VDVRAEEVDGAEHMNSMREYPAGRVAAPVYLSWQYAI
jgi:hypothetical protein